MGPGLYVHVPFCLRKCPYCAFFSRPPRPESVAAWLAGLQRECRLLPADFRPASIFFGGGTPTALAADDLQRLIDLVHRHVDTQAVAEWTCEANPGTLTPAKAARLKTGGVNRLSIGAQSFADDTLRRLGRIHTAAETRACVRLARAAGFDNLGLDLIYGVAGGARAALCADVEAALALEPEHLSGYCLEIEADTPFARAPRPAEITAAAEEQRAQFDWLRRRLAAGGWTHYEISNFARPGRECRQNLLYWSGGEYLGLGPAAHSHWRGVRWGHTPELPEWRRAFAERLAPAAKARETLVMGLRRLAGWRRADFRAATGCDYDTLRGPEIARLARQGLLVVEPDRIRLAADALFVSDSVFAELV